MRSLLTFAAVILAPALMAQRNDQAILRLGQSTSCPVGVEASPRTLPALRSVDRDTNARLHDRLAYKIALLTSDGKLVRSAQVKLIGIDEASMLRASDGDRGDLISERFTLPGAEAMVYTRHLTGVRWIQLEKVTYLDGEVWSQTPGSVCRVAPNALMPVDSASRRR
ncbi:hypothetical protein Terro_3177 [Terriglobus roseus DSM 18391]|uniref:Uncharacterized protein n=1 Tax=Terriglobus roseus (strain DSM 18391 / NRRL B-41598 / KBS 63) TaxID=926566 RepID=I3ZJI1_TERRK|nr:hypothetical protein Terro_3177 [Terriglobus roseus DSM 18391]